MDGSRSISGKPDFFLPVFGWSRLFRSLMPEKLVTAHQAARLQFLGAHASGRLLRRSRRGTRPHRAMAIPVGGPESAPGRLCCKSRKLQGHQFFAKTQNGKQSPIRIDAIALSKSPVSSTLGDEVPHIFTRKPRLRPLEFLILGAKRLLRHNQGAKWTLGRGASMSSPRTMHWSF